MATQLFLTTVASDYGTGNNDAMLSGTASGWTALLMRTTRGGAQQSAGTATVTGPTNGVEMLVSSLPAVWYSPPLDADVTISGSITWNIGAYESSMNANAAINGRLEVIDGATGAITLIDQTTRTVELTTSVIAENFVEAPASGVACKRGDRLRVRVFADDSAAATMASGFTFTVWYNGISSGGTGGTYLTLTETLTFASEPAGSQVFLTDTASAVSTASVDREAWTSRGGGVQTDVRNTAAGWTSPLQVTDTAGGTVVDWFTRPLAAFTMGGAVRCNIRALESNAAANASVRVEVARVEGDGTGATTWAAGTLPTELGTTEAAQSFLISGDDLAVSDGQRLRIRVSVDDPGAAAMAASQTVTLYYAGTSGGASGDTYLTFTQTLTEGSAGPPATDFTPSSVAASTRASAVTSAAVGLIPSAIASSTAIATPVAGPQVNITGTGAIAVPAVTTAATGSERLSATGAIIVPAATVAGTATERLTATGAIAVPAPTVAGTGAHTQTITATGAIAVPAPATSGTGSEQLTATGSITVGVPTVLGTGNHGAGTSLAPSPVAASTQASAVTSADLGMIPAPVAASTVVPTPAAGTGAPATQLIPSPVVASTAASAVTSAELGLIPTAVAASTAIPTPATAGATTLSPTSVAASTAAPSFDVALTLEATGALVGRPPSVVGTGTVQLVASGAVVASPVAVSGAGTTAGVTITGTGALVAQAPTVTGAGSESLAATGALAAPGATVAGTGIGGARGTGAVVSVAPAVAGTGSERLIATGSAIGEAPTVVGTGNHALGLSGSGFITVPAPVVAGTGTHLLAIPGTGAISAGSPAVSGTGTQLQTITGTGAIVGQPPTVAGTGTRTLITATGAVVGRAPSVVGTGTVTYVFTATGAVTGMPPVVSGTGLVTLVGTGAVAATPARVTATATMVTNRLQVGSIASVVIRDGPTGSVSAGRPSASVSTRARPTASISTRRTTGSVAVRERPTATMRRR